MKIYYKNVLNFWKQTIHAYSKRNRTTIYIAAIVHASVFQPLLMFEQLAISFDVR